LSAVLFRGIFRRERRVLEESSGSARVSLALKTIAASETADTGSVGENAQTAAASHAFAHLQSLECANCRHNSRAHCCRLHGRSVRNLQSVLVAAERIPSLDQPHHALRNREESSRLSRCCVAVDARSESCERIRHCRLIRQYSTNDANVNRQTRSCW